MTMKSVFAVVAVMTLGVAGAASAAEPLEVYQARLSDQDHHNSYGERLRTVAGIIRQDRANYHKFHVRDPEDTRDAFFAIAENRQRLETLLLRGTVSPRAQQMIIDGEPVVEVRVYRNHVDVDVEE